MFRFLDNGLYEDVPAPDEGGGTPKEEPNILKVNVRGNEKDFDLSDRDKLAGELSKAADYEIRGEEFNAEKARLQGEAEYWRNKAEQDTTPSEPEPTFTMDDGFGNQVPDPNAKLTHKVEQLEAANAKRERESQQNEAVDALNQMVEYTTKGKEYASSEFGKDLVTARFVSIRGREPTQQDLTRITTEVDEFIKDKFTNADNLPKQVKDAIVQNYLDDKDKTKKKTQGIPVKGTDRAPVPEPERIVDAEKAKKAFDDDDAAVERDRAYLESLPQGD